LEKPIQKATKQFEKFPKKKKCVPAPIFCLSFELLFIKSIFSMKMIEFEKQQEKKTFKNTVISHSTLKYIL
jgi:hypothetical protein